LSDGLSIQVEGFRTRWYHVMMNPSGTISHDLQQETPEAKARWFRSLPMSERMELLCSFTDLALTINPALQERRHAQPVAGRIQIIAAP
jgi:hypothetical protein